MISPLWFIWESISFTSSKIITLYCYLCSFIYDIENKIFISLDWFIFCNCV